MGRIKAVFFDIDGTLVSFATHAVPANTAAAVRRLRAAGIKVFIASGRHMSCIDNLGDLQFDGYVTINGGMTIVGDEVIDRFPMSRNDVKRFCQELEPSMPCAFAVEDKVVLNRHTPETDEVIRLVDFKTLEMANLNDYADKDVYQFVAFFGPDEEAEVMKHLPESEVTRWHPLFADVVPKGSSKVRGIQALEKHFGISRDEIMAFGDGGNDVEMLEYAAIGIAMGNAVEHVKAKADYVTSSVDDDGVGRAIKKFIGI